MLRPTTLRYALSAATLLITALPAAIAGPIGRGQSGATASSLSPSTATATQTAKPQAFEVASMRVSPPGGSGQTTVSDWGTPRFTAHHATLQLLLEIAFEIDADQIVNAPQWNETQGYDVDAEADAPLSYEQARPLVLQLLQERLHLAFHRETKYVPGYALVIGKDGAKLHAVEQGHAYGQIMPDRLSCPSCGTASLSGMLTRVLHRPVEDKTGLQGTYDIQLRYAPLNDDASGATDSPLPSLLTAVQEQAGLKLVSQKVPIEMLVIDHIDREPTEN